MEGRKERKVGEEGKLSSNYVEPHVHFRYIRTCMFETKFILTTSYQVSLHLCMVVCPHTFLHQSVCADLPVCVAVSACQCVLIVQ